MTTRLPEPNFIERDADKITQEWIDGNFSVTPDEHKRTEELINILEGS